MRNAEVNGEKKPKEDNDDDVTEDEQEECSEEGETNSMPKVLLCKISPPLYINSRKLAKESSTKRYHTVIEPFDLATIEQDLYIRSNKIHSRQ